MTALEVVKDVMKVKGFSQMKLALASGYKRQGNITNIFRVKNMRSDNLIKLLNAMDCDLIVRSRTEMRSLEHPGTMFKPEWVIEMGPDEAEESGGTPVSTEDVPDLEPDL